MRWKLTMVRAQKSESTGGVQAQRRRARQPTGLYRTPVTAKHGWAAVADTRTTRPGLCGELLLSGSVVCDPIEAEQAIAWGRAHVGRAKPIAAERRSGRSRPAGL
jgi:hypothetical protein